MTARTLLSIGKALEKRYLGYLGLMYSAYEFAICMKQKDDRPSYSYYRLNSKRWKETRLWYI